MVTPVCNISYMVYNNGNGENILSRQVLRIGSVGRTGGTDRRNPLQIRVHREHVKHRRVRQGGKSWEKKY